MFDGRKDERPKTWFRSERVFASNGQWYFHTREGVDVGPYDNRCDAEIEAGLLKELLKEADVGEPAVGVLREFVLDSFSLGRPLEVAFADLDAAVKRAVQT